MLHNCVYICLYICLAFVHVAALQPHCSFDGRNPNEHTNNNEINSQIEQTKNDNQLTKFVPEDDSTANQHASTLLDICDDGKVDAGMREIDGTIYLFKKFGFVIIRPDGAKANVSYLTKSIFDHLPYKPDYAITISDPHNTRYGRSLFYKNGKFYEYLKTTFVRVTNTKNWDFKLDPDSKPFYYFGDSIMAYYDKKASMVGLFFQKVFVLVDLHTIEMPDRPRMQIIENIPNYFNYINQVIPLPDDRWMIFLSYPTYGAYCIIDNVTTTTEFICNERSLRDDFLTCPNDFNDLVNQNWFTYLWESSGLSQDRLLFVIRGVLVGLIQGLSFLYLMTYYQEPGDDRTATMTTGTFATMTKTAECKSTEKSCN